ncbi:MAG: A24 family peptidase, partial [Candidatus Limnocylindrales bacterium]
HDDGHVRPIDWRTAVVMVLGAGSMYLLPQRFTETGPLVLFGVYFLALILLLATDLDQRLLPDVITLPMIPISLVVTVAGWNPLVPQSGLLGAAIVALAVPAGLFALSIPFGEGAIGLGDLKLLVSVGLLSGLSRTVIGVIGGALLAGIVIVVLLATRRVTMKSYIPFGPFLIAGAFWAALVNTA